MISYYERFLVRFPNLEDLATAEWEEFLPYWRGLGFYSRGKNMIQAAKIVMEKHHGIFPPDSAELIKLPGIGPYTAAAIVSFAYRKPEPAIDTNLQRVFQRVFGCTEKGVLYRARALFQAAKNDSPALNQAIMDIGSLLCTARKVNCEACPLSSECHFLQSGKRGEWEQSLLGIGGIKRLKSAKIPMEVAVACIHRNGKYLIAKRPPEKGGSWEFPGGKREKGEDWRHCLKREIQEELGIEIAARPHFFEKTWEQGDYLWRLRFARCQILHGEPVAHEHTELKWVYADELFDYDFPQTNRKAVEALKKMKI